MAKGINSLMYFYMVTSHVVSKVRQLYGNRAVWQDNPAWIHRRAKALEACAAFTSGIPYDIQALKMADVWPIKKCWAIVREGVMEKEPENKNQLN